jgi:hypothetical protein
MQARGIAPGVAAADPHNLLADHFSRVLDVVHLDRLMGL